jgi:hypothetical protein
MQIIVNKHVHGMTCCCGYCCGATADFAGSDHFSIKEKQLLFKGSELASQTQ